jgi:hypothetical protein
MLGRAHVIYVGHAARAVSLVIRSVCVLNGASKTHPSNDVGCLVNHAEGIRAIDPSIQYSHLTGLGDVARAQLLQTCPKSLCRPSSSGIGAESGEELGMLFSEPSMGWRSR